MRIKNKKIYIIATINDWNKKEAKAFINNNPDIDLILIKEKKELDYQKISKFNPRYIFFPHWSWVIQEKIFKNFECIVFHMTDLPLGRGGSPLQNLILKGINKTKISALKVIKKLDAGPIYMKRNLSLEGSAEEIYKRASRIIFNDMIPSIIKNEPKPVQQVGKVTIFERRKPEQSKIPEDISFEKIYDFIRMLDAEGYPRAYIEYENIRFEFLDAIDRKGFVEVRIFINKREREK